MKRSELTPHQRTALGEAHSLRCLYGHVHGLTIQALWRKGLVRLSNVGGSQEAHLTNEGRDLRDSMRSYVDGQLEARGWSKVKLNADATDGVFFKKGDSDGVLSSRAAAMRKAGVSW